jgi:hypothetical protein
MTGLESKTVGHDGIAVIGESRHERVAVTSGRSNARMAETILKAGIA